MLMIRLMSGLKSLKHYERLQMIRCFSPTLKKLISANNFGLPNESIILCHQIRTLDNQRLTLLYGEIGDPKKQEEIIDALCFQLGIERSISTDR